MRAIEKTQGDYEQVENELSAIMDLIRNCAMQCATACANDRHDEEARSQTQQFLRLTSEAEVLRQTRDRLALPQRKLWDALGQIDGYTTHDAYIPPTVDEREAHAFVDRTLQELGITG